MDGGEKWLSWAVELQSLAQAGLHYSKDAFDLERFQRVREIAAEMLSEKSGTPVETVRDLFCCETGYQTPKLDVRAAIFQGDKILLVRERRTGNWSLPGGWVDVNLSVAESAAKEAKEEAGLDVSPDLVIAVQDREKHNFPVYAWKICKVFMLCTARGGAFAENAETTESGYFPLDALPPLSMEKNTPEQVAMCFEAHHTENWKTRFD